ncbi:tripartite ATP-independent transporter DctM subunit [Sinobaca qinghaiensis]|uniref:Tripartite ATP-independent transporter DctM subunit n=1 Tax=Sinobaca qinghaiensis TaxID=342944 RepID=A0A419V8E5_9BACL|nr:TRAP transporter large permease [Sinobaca qinghaiensis]RKD76327.1 tripartite ATP-independent transporter DctM subunit [Sinobaca qinghaiensis]
MIWVLIAFVVFILINVPIAFAIGAAGLVYFLLDPNLPTELAIQRFASGTQSFPLLAVPFFVLAGNLLNETGITKRLIDFADALIGHIVGGLAHVSILLSAMMGGISGSANADAAMQSRILAPQMIAKGYSGGFSVSVIALSALITATIPPSIGLILFGFVGEVSIGQLFMAGIIPGILMTLTLLITSTIIAKKRKYVPSRVKRASFKEVVVTFRRSFWGLLFPVILIVGIRFGVFTASEAGAFAVVYAFVVGAFIYKELNWAKLNKVLKNTVEDNAVIMLIIAAAAILGHVITSARLPQEATQGMLSLTENPILIMVIILTFLLVAGMFMESTVNTLLLTPILLPIVVSIGMDPVHFGIVMMTIVTMGGMTPPIGVTMYTACSLANVPVIDYMKESVPFILSIIVFIILLVVFPQITLFLPELLMR